MLPGWVRGYRLLFGVVALYAIIWNMREKNDQYFWNFFTNQSGLITAVVLVLGALVFAKINNPEWWDVVRGIAVISMLVTGIVYATLLGGFYNPFTTTEHTWASSVLHQLVEVEIHVSLFEDEK